MTSSKPSDPASDIHTAPPRPGNVQTVNGEASPSTADGRAPRDWAICCSGGGIRSAAYCLGALQSLDAGHLLAKARWILGVSGGSYIATSRALVAHNLRPGEKNTHAYAPGTAEERNLRYDTRYIAPNASTVLVGALSLILGAICTFAIVLAPVYAVTHAWGWLLRWQGVLVPGGKDHTMTSTVSVPGWWLPSVIAAVITLILFLYWWGTLEPGGRRAGRLLERFRRDDRDRSDGRAWLVGWAAFLTMALALAMFAVPPLIAWLTTSHGPAGTIAHFLGFGAKPTWSLPGLAGLIAAITAVARYSQAGLAKWTASTTAAKGNSAAAQSGVVGQLAGQLRQQVLPWVSSVAVVLIVAVFSLLWTYNGAKAGFSWDQLLPVGIALAVALLARITVNINRLSMHDFYRWRLADAFAVTRQAAEERNPGEARRLFADAAATRLSQLPNGDGETDEPGLVVCGTANINALREAPPGQGGYCVTFDPDQVVLHREKGLAGERAAARTSDYEALIGNRRSTLFDVSAISGAAVSPLMGSATRHAYRILFTATNISLGVWLPHPNVVRDARTWITKQQENAAGQPADDSTSQPAEDSTTHPTEDSASQWAERDTRSWWEDHPLLLLLWYLTPKLPSAKDDSKSREREARLWAHVLQSKIDGKHRGAIWYRFMQPTLGLLWAEAAGRLSYRATWMYVTDGGHYDNLGLVEALRRGARNIIVLDASGDKPDTWFTLGGAMALARTDVGVEIDLDPTTMVSGGQNLAHGEVVRPWAHGRFYRSPEVKDLPSEGDIWVCKLGWWSGAPWDILAYAKGHSTYPCDGTLEQLYNSDEFRAYHQLGVATVLDAAECCEPPFPWVPPAGVPTAGALNGHAGAPETEAATGLAGSGSRHG